MFNIQKGLVIVFVFCAVFIFNRTTDAQSPIEEYTGTIISYNGPRVETAYFTLRIKSLTSDAQADSNLEILQEGGQDKLLSAIQKQDVGTFSVGNRLARTVNIVRESQVDGKKRIFVVFERWMRFAEIRGSYRSTDYPFGVVELLVDETTLKGDGTYIAAAQIKWDKDKKTNQDQLEVENFATYPAKLTEVKGKN